MHGSAELGAPGLCVCWIAAIGAGRAQDVMARFGMGRTVAYRRLGELVAQRVLRAVRFSVAAPALYVATRDGLAWAGLEDVDPARQVRDGPRSVPRAG